MNSKFLLRLSLIVVICLAGMTLGVQAKASAAAYCFVLVPLSSANKGSNPPSPYDCLYGQADPQTALTSLNGTSNQLKSQFIAKINNFLTGSINQQIGAKYIQNHISGNSGMRWDDRLKLPDVTISIDPAYTYSDNTGYNPVTNSLAHIKESATWPALIFKIENAQKFVIKLSCGNILDNPNDLSLPAPPIIRGYKVDSTGNQYGPYSADTISATNSVPADDSAQQQPFIFSIQNNPDPSTGLHNSTISAYDKTSGWQVVGSTYTFCNTANINSSGCPTLQPADPSLFSTSSYFLAGNSRHFPVLKDGYKYDMRWIYKKATPHTTPNATIAGLKKGSDGSLVGPFTADVITATALDGTPYTSSGNTSTYNISVPQGIYNITPGNNIGGYSASPVSISRTVNSGGTINQDFTYSNQPACRGFAIQSPNYVGNSALPFQVSLPLNNLTPTTVYPSITTTGSNNTTIYWSLISGDTYHKYTSLGTTNVYKVIDTSYQGTSVVSMSNLKSAVSANPAIVDFTPFVTGYPYDNNQATVYYTSDYTDSVYKASTTPTYVCPSSATIDTSVKPIPWCTTIISVNPIPSASNTPTTTASPPTTTTTTPTTTASAPAQAAPTNSTTVVPSVIPVKVNGKSSRYHLLSAIPYPKVTNLALALTSPYGDRLAYVPYSNFEQIAIAATSSGSSITSTPKCPYSPSYTYTYNPITGKCEYYYGFYATANYQYPSTTNRPSTINAPSSTSASTPPCFARGFSVTSVSAPTGVNLNNYENPTSATVSGSTASVKFYYTDRAPTVGLRLPMTANLSYYYGAASNVKSCTSGGSLPVSGSNGVTTTVTLLASGCSITPPSSPGGIEVGAIACVNANVIPTGSTVNPDGSINSNNGATLTSISGCSGPVVNEPYFKVFGGDISVGGGFGNSCTNITSAGIFGWNVGSNSTGVYDATTQAYAGAGAQYLLSSPGIQSGVTSNQNNPHAAFPALSSSSSPVPDPFGLTLANDSNGPGVSGFINCLHDYYSSLPATQLSFASPTTSLDGSNGTYKVDGDLTITKSNISRSKIVTVYVNGNLDISDNINFVNGNGNSNVDATYTAVNQIPSLIFIVSGNIYISNSVTNISGLLIAQPTGSGSGGNIYDCSVNFAQVSTNQLYTSCNNQLTVNGSFIADKVVLNRTNSSLRSSSNTETNTRTNASEIFNYSPAFWMSTSLPQSITSSTSAGYDSLINLPPVL